jgi:hypothetical protein
MESRSQLIKKGKSAEQSISRFCPLKSLKKSHPVNKTRNLYCRWRTHLCARSTPGVQWKTTIFPMGMRGELFAKISEEKNSKI